MLIRGLLAGVAAAVFLSGCQVLDDSKAMRKTLEELKGKGDHIADRADGLEQKMKEKESTAFFAAAIQLLFGENGSNGLNGPTDDKNVETEMLNFAETAVRAMFFQFWNGNYKEHSLETFDDYFEKSVMNMFTRLRGHMAGYKVDVMMPDRHYKGVASFAARMDQMQNTYVAALKARGLPENLSLYEVIMQALENRNQVQQVGLLPRTKARVLQWNGEAVYLMQLRHNYLPMLVISRMTDISDRGDVRRAIMAIRGQKIDLASQDPYRQITNEKLREWTHWLKLAQETRVRLRAMGIAPEYNSVMGTILRAPDFGQTALLALPPVEIRDERKRLEVEFAKAYVQVVNEMPNMIPAMPSMTDIKEGAKSFVPDLSNWKLPAAQLPSSSGPYPSALPREKLM